MTLQEEVLLLRAENRVLREQRIAELEERQRRTRRKRESRRRWCCTNWSVVRIADAG